MSEGQVTVTLPAAPPGAYLGWMAFCREVEQRLAEHRTLLDIASRQSAPFAGDEVADFLSAEVVLSLIRQASEPQKRGDPLVAPQLTGRRDLLERGIRYVSLRGTWIEEHDLAQAMGIEPLEPELGDLRDAVLDAVEAGLAEDPV